MQTKNPITVAGRRVTKKQIAHIQETVRAFPALSLRELGHTLCEHFRWLTPTGKSQIQSCLTALETMAQRNLITLPAKIECQKRGPQKKIIWTERTQRPATITGPITQFMPLRLEVVRNENDIALWNELIDRYHYLGFKRPIGSHLRYFILDHVGNKLGCMLFSFAVWTLSCRDEWIGWERQAREARLKFVLNNNRFLIFPWVEIKNLASKALSMAAQRIAEDWQTFHGYRPVLLETFTDPSQFKATCYRAANWQCIGKTAGNKTKPAKDVYVYPLTRHYQTLLVQGKRPNSLKKILFWQTNKAPDGLTRNDPFVRLWHNVLNIVIQVTADFDQQWQKRRRILNSLLLVLFIFRLVFSKNKQSYHTTIAELWAQCRTMRIPLPQAKPVAASAFCNARAKLDEGIFKRLNVDIIRAYDTQNVVRDWRGHRLFAVDGTKITLPRSLTTYGYRSPSDNAYYPQGLVSCLYQLKPRIPIDFILVPDSDERKAAQTHLQALQPNDVVIYDRGYFSYAMLYYHIEQDIQAIFRLRKNISSPIDEFADSEKTDHVIEFFPSTRHQAVIRACHPQIKFKPIKLRLIKYHVSGTTYILGTTLLDQQRYPAHAFSDVYHARWGIEELYKVSKELIDVEDFHGQTERGVKQELYAHFVLITLTRLFANHVDDGFCQPGKEDTLHPFKVNFKNCLATVARNLEALFLDQAMRVNKTLTSILDTIRTCRQRVRPDRTYHRQSRKPMKKWQLAKEKRAVQATSA
ncbi:MAG: IS4 family transposase [Proteobacteria bacterium]|nr:IS4 family transposase [Pseudomonadota bacterium]